jgi:TIR domain/YceI-like domain
MSDTTRAVFLSYRREETRHLAGRLADRLTERLGSTRVFMDVDAIEPGVDFAAAITREVALCDVLIALIGPTWSTIIDRRGRRKLDDPDDFVVLEIQTALEREIHVIPVLTDGAIMPDQYDLPEGLRSLAKRNAIRLDHETFRSDIGPLLEAVERMLPPLARKAAEPTTRPRAQVTFDATAVDCRVSVFVEGMLTSFGHDATLRVTNLSMVIAGDNTITADFFLDSLRVIDGISEFNRKDIKDIERNAEKALESRKYPKVQFRSVSVVRNGTNARIEGDLTLHGVTNRISVEAHDDGKRWNAKIILDQRAFAIKPFSAILGALKIKPEVEVNISVPHP